MFENTKDLVLLNEVLIYMDILAKVFFFWRNLGVTKYCEKRLCDFRCGVPLFIVIHVIYQYKNRQKKMLNVRLAGGHLYGKQLLTWLSLVVSITASICAVRFPTRCLG